MADDQTLIELTADIVAAHVSNNSVAVGEVGSLLQGVHQALSSLGEPAAATAPEKKSPAVSVRASVKPDHIVCLACGKKQKTLKRHLHTAHQMTPAAYRSEFGLQPGYPMVAPDYSQRRQEMARKIGLGRKRPEATEADQDQKPQRKKRARKAPQEA